MLSNNDISSVLDSVSQLHPFIKCRHVKDIEDPKLLDISFKMSKHYADILNLDWDAAAKVALNRELRYSLELDVNDKLIAIKPHLNLSRRDFKIEALFSGIDTDYFGYASKQIVDNIYLSGANYIITANGLSPHIRIHYSEGESESITRTFSYVGTMVDISNKMVYEMRQYNQSSSNTNVLYMIPNELFTFEIQSIENTSQGDNVGCTVKYAITLGDVTSIEVEK